MILAINVEPNDICCACKHKVSFNLLGLPEVE